MIGKKFFTFNSPSAAESLNQTRYSPDEGVEYLEGPSCPLCGSFLGPNIWKKPFKIELELLGNHFGDFASFCGIPPNLMSEAVVEAYKKSDLTGLIVHGEVVVYKVIPARMLKQFPRYFYTSVVKSRVPIDAELSEMHYLDDAQPCPECRLASPIMGYERIVLDKAEQPDEDIFVARGLPGIVIASERFKEFCESNHFTNCAFTPLSESSYHS